MTKNIFKISKNIFGKFLEILEKYDIFKIFPKNIFRNFENTFLSWKINIFHPDFFSVQGMIILHRIVTPALSLFHCARNGPGRGPRTLQNHPNPPSYNIFSRRSSFVTLSDSRSFEWHTLTPTVDPGSWIITDLYKSIVQGLRCMQQQAKAGSAL